MKKKWLLTGVVFFWLLRAFATLQPLPLQQVFIANATVPDIQTIVLHWQIAPGYFLYRDRLRFELENSAPATLGTPQLPKGTTHYSPESGHYKVFKKSFTLDLPLLNNGKNQLTLLAHYQGCSSAGFCYPPAELRFALDTRQLNQKVTGTPIDATAQPLTTAVHSQLMQATTALTHQPVWLIFISFVGFGLLLTFTPCVLPMIPILSSIIIGQRKRVSTRRAFLLSLAYVLSMALTYAVAGLLFGLLGGSLQSSLQKPWVLILFSLLFVILSLSFFGFYELKLPEAFEERITRLSNRQKSGSYLGAIIMGCLATLIISPCVTPALAAALGYIGQSGNAFMGGISLFAMGLGMGLPLLLIGTLGGGLLPKAGAWLETVEHLCGILLIAAAIWMLERILPGSLSLLLWACLLIVCSVYSGAFTHAPVSGWDKFRKGFGLILLGYGFLMLIGAASGNSNPLRPISNLSGNKAVSEPHAAMKTVYSLAELKQALMQAKLNQQPVVVDFYADWCIACKELEHTVLADDTIQKQLTPFLFIRADVTANNAANLALLKQYNVIAPPTFLFFNRKGEWLKNATLVGTMSKKEFSASLESVAL